MFVLAQLFTKDHFRHKTGKKTEEKTCETANFPGEPIIFFAVETTLFRKRGLQILSSASQSS